MDSLIRKRNAIEHPGGHSGHLHVHDFQTMNHDGKIGVLSPIWRRNDERSEHIESEMSVLNTNLFTFCEESILLFLECFPKPSILCLQQIPEDKRRSEYPVKYKMGLNRKGIQMVQQCKPKTDSD